MTSKICGIYGYYDTYKKRIIYVGQSKHCENRNKTHYYKKRYNEQVINRILQNDKNNRYKFKILLECKEYQLDDKEKEFIKKYKPLFNFTKGGRGDNKGANSMHYNIKRPDVVKRNKIKNPMHDKEIAKKASINRKGKCVGKDNPNSKYTLWDSNLCRYNVGNMYHNNRTPNPCKCFEFSYQGNKVTGIGGFHDFISCYILNTLVNKFI